MSVSVIIVTYNAEETIKDCLESLNNQTFRDFEAILVDNTSKDRTRDIVDAFKRASTYKLKTIYLSDNRGFCGGNNTALSETSGEFIALLNPDAKADAFWLEELYNGMDDARVGICASKVLTWDGRQIDSAGDIMASTFRGFKRESEESSSYSKEEFVFGACAAGALYRKRMIDEIGFFDEDFFIQCDDTDLNFRAQLGGWKVLYIPTARIFHKVSLSIGKASDIGVYYSQRNMEFLKMKNVPLPVLLRHIPQMLFGYAADFLYFGIKHGKWRLFIKAKADALRMLPLMMEKRRHLMGKVKKVDNAYISSLICPLSSNRRLVSMKLKKFFSHSVQDGKHAT